MPVLGLVVRPRMFLRLRDLFHRVLFGLLDRCLDILLPLKVGRSVATGKVMGSSLLASWVAVPGFPLCLELVSSEFQRTTMH